MLPASRTPDGSPANCDICGAAVRVLVSDPPRDSVCPNCGSYLQHFRDASHSLNVQAAIQNFLRKLPELAQDDQRRAALPSFLTRNLTFALAALGASVWRFDGKHTRLLDTFGDAPEREHVEAIRLQESAVIQLSSPENRLLLGVPLIELGHLVGAIQVVKQNVESNNLKKGYARFLEMVATLTSQGIAKLA